MARRRLQSQSGDISLVQDGVSAASYQGDRDYQEDRFAIARLGTQVDGGKTFLAGIFRKAADATNDNLEGSTGTGVVIDKDLQLTTAFLGDSPVVIFVRDPATGDISATQITKDHHPRDPDERERLKQEGARVTRSGRLVGGTAEDPHSLAISRAFGDHPTPGLSHEPEWTMVDLKKDIDAGKEVYVLVSSDGLYDQSRPRDYIAALKAAIADDKESMLADIFSAVAYARGSADNITALVYKVPQKLDAPLFLAIADGHGGDVTSQKVIETFKSGARATAPSSPAA